MFSKTIATELKRRLQKVQTILHDRTLSVPVNPTVNSTDAPPSPSVSGTVAPPPQPSPVAAVAPTATPSSPTLASAPIPPSSPTAQPVSPPEGKDPELLDPEWLDPLADVEPLLTGKLKSTSKRDLLQLENAALQHWAALLKQENAQLTKLLEIENAKDSATKQQILSEAHNGLRETHNEMLHQRQQTAVDIVEFVFRALNARPPPRQRLDSTAVRVRQSTVHSTASAPSSSSATSPALSSHSHSQSFQLPSSRLSTVSTKSSVSISSDHMEEITSNRTSVPRMTTVGTIMEDEERPPTNSVVSGGSGGSSTPGSPLRQSSATKVSFADGTNGDTPTAARRPPPLPPRPAVQSVRNLLAPQLTASPRRRSQSQISRSGAAGVETFSVFKVNMFRKNSPHLLEVDVRTMSISIKDANNISKVEIASNSLLELKPERPLLILGITYLWQAKDKDGGGWTAVNKRYKFPSEKFFDRFYELANTHIFDKDKAEQNWAKAGLPPGGVPIVTPSALTISSATTPSPSNSLPSPVSSVISLPRPSLVPASVSAASLQPPTYGYTPSPLDTGRVEVPEFLADVADAIASNMVRGWTTSHSKDKYFVDEKEQINPKVRLREQLKLFMRGTTSPFQNVSYILADRLLRSVLLLGYTITLPAFGTRKSIAEDPKSSSPSSSEEFTPQLKQLIQRLALDSHEIWCELAMRSQLRRFEKEKQKAVAAENEWVQQHQAVYEQLLAEWNKQVEVIKAAAAQQLGNGRRPPPPPISAAVSSRMETDGTPPPPPPNGLEPLSPVPPPPRAADDSAILDADASPPPPPLPQANSSDAPPPPAPLSPVDSNDGNPPSPPPPPPPGTQTSADAESAGSSSRTSISQRESVTIMLTRPSVSVTSAVEDEAELARPELSVSRSDARYSASTHGPLVLNADGTPVINIPAPPPPPAPPAPKIKLPALQLVPYDKLDKVQQQSHVNDATEVIRTLLEFGFLLTKKLPAPPPLPPRSKDATPVLPPRSLEPSAST